MPVLLSRIEAREVARACRMLAKANREQAKSLGPCGTGDILLKAAAKMDALSERFEAHARTGLPSGRSGV
jgi:hypothetical protein